MEPIFNKSETASFGNGADSYGVSRFLIKIGATTFIGVGLPAMAFCIFI